MTNRASYRELTKLMSGPGHCHCQVRVGEKPPGLSDRDACAVLCGLGHYQPLDLQTTSLPSSF
jgi:hypothetical protein